MSTQSRLLKVKKLCIFTLIPFSFLHLSCSEDNLPKYIELGDLRILTLIANTPEVNPGTTVTITPYVSDLKNTGPLTYAWQACVDPGVGYGSEPTCANNSTATSITTGTISTLNSANIYTGNADNFNVTVPTTILVNRSTADQYNGVAYLVTYSLTNALGQTVKSFKRIIVSESTKSSKNQNPSLTGLSANGSSFTTLAAATTYQMVAQTSPNPESYSVKDEKGNLTSKTEVYQITWFYTDGEMKFYRTENSDTNEYKTPSAFSSTRGSFLVLVLRDGRGGISVQRYKVSD